MLRVFIGHQIVFREELTVQKEQDGPDNDLSKSLKRWKEKLFARDITVVALLIDEVFEVTVFVDHSRIAHSTAEEIVEEVVEGECIAKWLCVKLFSISKILGRLGIVEFSGIFIIDR